MQQPSRTPWPEYPKKSRRLKEIPLQGNACGKTQLSRVSSMACRRIASGIGRLTGFAYFVDYIPVVDWVTVSKEHSIFIADVGLSHQDCDQIVSATETVCRGQYTAYTYAKQTLSCREHPPLVEACFPPVHTVVHAIREMIVESQQLELDDREPHVVKYDTTKKERQKLDMHTDKSVWTFLIALSNGCGVDYEGGGTYFECIDAVVHLQRGHTLIFPGKLRHCGKKIVGGLRFLLVGFLVDKLTTKQNLVNKQSGRTSVTNEDEDHGANQDTNVENFDIHNEDEGVEDL